ncbi:uncharacterized protein PADG_08128 [Paracoccidioides brasiliensis Pb18]|uniref:Condensin complex subunit 1 C-terminal domain-containing protein n=1 Tax=Paracoccidioides brasiliensis (strain Pb18) TaxID=502780 RepID=C1GM42_PARBD|nr:uncharacterized protein PADG_08128 [Paracoccidioides brasiliensis Pb18]EEH43508.2 hypothetical protein PADG_08128 [Paracoccidioides brasiliensis Pb18]
MSLQLTKQLLAVLLPRYGSGRIPCNTPASLLGRLQTRFGVGFRLKLQKLRAKPNMGERRIKFVEATIQPLKQLLADDDPYVRKTAAFCVAKLYDHDRKLVERSDLILQLNDMLKDDNPTVVSSALAALTDLWERSNSITLTIDYKSASK